MIRQMFSWIAMSTIRATRIAKANAARSWTVNVVVWVRNPGPMADVAIRNIAPRNPACPACRRATDSSAAGASTAAEGAGSGPEVSAIDQG